jgi:hypothetical protein
MARWAVAALGLDENSGQFKYRNIYHKEGSIFGFSNDHGLRKAVPHHSANIQLTIFGLCDVAIKFNEIANHV